MTEVANTRAQDAAVAAATGVSDAVLLAVNGVLHEVRGAQAFMTLSGFLREELRLTGTKIVCSEGDCGACSALVGELDANGGGFSYRSIDACIAFVFQLHRCHVITVDGLAKRQNAQTTDDLHPVQRAMAENYGSQCGFCTPGFVVAITDLVSQARDRDQTLNEGQVRTALSGNLCRCTGYVQILDAVRGIDLASVPTANRLFDEAPLIETFSCAAPAISVEHEGCVAHVPKTAADALAVRARKPQARVVAGATDLGVRFNKGQLTQCDWLHLRSDLEGFSDLVWDPDRRQLTLGACVRWSRALERVQTVVPVFAEILERFGGPQIRNMGTVGGNIMNASPIADALPFLYVSDARLELASTSGVREVEIADFFLGYKTFDLEPEELLQRVRLRVPDTAVGERVLLLKASRRRDLDISTFTAALWLRVNEGHIADARVAYGGVGPTVLRLPGAESELVGKPLEKRTFVSAGDLAASEITPISDVRGAAAYRTLLARNVMLRFFEQLTEGQEATP